MGILCNHETSAFYLNNDGISKQHKMMPEKDFYQSLKGLSWF